MAGIRRRRRRFAPARRSGSSLRLVATARRQGILTRHFDAELERDLGMQNPRIRTLVLLFGLTVMLAVVLRSVAATEPSLRRPWNSSRLVGIPQPPAPYRVVPSFPKLRFDHPTSIEPMPGTERLIVTEMDGKILSFPKRSDVTTPELMLDLRSVLPPASSGQNVSLFDLELHPRFPDERSVFVCYVVPGEQRHSRVSRFTIKSLDPPMIDPTSEQVLITWPAGGHNGGCLEFGPDGYLYISTGDGSGPNPPDGLTTGQDVSDLLGSILRIDVYVSGDQPYTVPSDNPFVGQAPIRPEIWSYGLRNPWKFGIDRENGKVFVADNGWESWEMIHLATPGANAGWPVMEGRAALRTEVSVGPTPIQPPLKDHPHTEANSVIGGPVYRGQRLPDLNGSFLYGDYITGTIWSVRQEPDGTCSHSTLVDTVLRIVAFEQDADGRVYVLDYDLTGQIYELQPSHAADRSASFPRRLSETGLFTSLSPLVAAPGVEPYEPLISRWLDGARASRWVAVPDNGKIRLSAGKSPSEYPDGTVFVKQITMPRGAASDPTPVETQLLHWEDGEWRPYSYLWDESGNEATLVDSIGTSRQLPPSSAEAAEKTWHVNATNECKLCHNVGPGYILGFVPEQLHRSTATTSELDRLVSRGVLEKYARTEIDEQRQLVDPHDASKSLNDRARSYLHVNCAMCHHPGGNAIVSFFLSRDLPLDKLNTNKGTGIGTFGMRDARIIAPGDPYRSVLLYRMSKLGYGRMPYIGSRVVDGSAIALIEDWIRSLPAPANIELSSPAIADSEASKLLIQLGTGRPLPRRDDSLNSLLLSTETTLALIAQLHRNAPHKDDQSAAIELGRKLVSSDRRGLIDTFVPESQRRATLGTRVEPQSILTLQGDRSRGQLIYFSDGARCRACHDVRDPSKSTGPTLREINKKYPQLSDKLQHTLQPSLKVDEAYVAYVALTNDGQAISGLLVEQNDRKVVLKTADRRILQFEKDQIESLQRSQKSLMPDSILSDLTAQEAADLFAYIESLE